MKLVVITAIAEFEKEVKNFPIIDDYVQWLENRIRENPADWLWTHRRWKYNLNKDQVKNKKYVKLSDEIADEIK